MHKSLGQRHGSRRDHSTSTAPTCCACGQAPPDYHVDVRCSDEIFKQLSQNYLKFRNTAQATASATSTASIADDLVKPRRMMLELDKWAAHPPQRVSSRRPSAAYDDYEFHAVSHAHQRLLRRRACSSFYISISSTDRLYCAGADSLARRSAQTALFLILDTLTKMFAPDPRLHLR